MTFEKYLRQQSEQKITFCSWVERSGKIAFLLGTNQNNWRWISFYVEGDNLKFRCSSIPSKAKVAAIRKAIEESASKKPPRKRKK